MTLNLTLHIWRQPDRKPRGKLVTYKVTGVSTHASFLEMLDILNEQLIAKGEEPVAFDHDCREGICGMCSLMINGRPHGGRRATTTCQLHMRLFHDGDEIWIEPWRAARVPGDQGSRASIARRSTASSPPAASSPRTAARRPTPTTSWSRRRTPTARSRPPPASAAARAWPRARTARRCCSSPPSSPTCTTCRRASPSASTARSRWSPRWTRPGFGNCSNHYECEAACPKEISRDVMALLNRDYAKASFAHRERVEKGDGAG